MIVEIDAPDIPWQASGGKVLEIPRNEAIDKQPIGY
jgi:hypothetical protein